MPIGLLNSSSGAAAGASPSEEVLEFHSRLPEYKPSPLHEPRGLAEKLGVAKLWVKDEASRMGLPSFKVLGASWATFRALEEAAGQSLKGWDDVAELGAMVRRSTGVRTLSAATDGNHGRAVARTAGWLGLESRIYVPRGTSGARIDAIESEGASVTIVEGSYGAAVARSAEDSDDGCLVISDTSWEGYTSVPSWVIDGYSTIFAEVDRDLSARRGEAPDVVVVQIGVGALAAAVVRHYRSPGVQGPRILGVEPDTAACAMASARRGTPETVPGPHSSIMVGLNCDTPSIVAWPDVSSGVNAFVSVEDDFARIAMRLLATEGVVSGETGAAGLAGLVAIRSAQLTEVAEALGLSENSSVLVISTEGATDPAAYQAAVGMAPAEIGG